MSKFLKILVQFDIELGYTGIMVANVRDVVPVHSIRSFTWNGRKGTAEISELGNRPYTRLWDDACDVGFVVKSTKTGVEKVFCLIHVQKNNDGDIMWWDFVDLDENVDSELIKIRLFND